MPMHFDEDNNLYVTMDASEDGGGATEAKQDTQITAEQAIQATAGATTGAAVITDANGTIQQYLRGLVKRWVDALGAGTAAAALRVTLASDDPLVALRKAATGTVTSVNSAATSTSVLALNTARKGASITNTDANAVLLLLSTGGTASASNYTVKVPSDGYFEVPFGYTGAIIGIWLADGAGVALVTEYT